jgi:membrane-bound lytic murein transglycosylase D
METKRYVPKLIAAIIIARNPEKYGFTDIAYKKPQEYETINLPGGVSLEAVAATANTSVKELRALNNELRKSQIPPKNEYALRIPTGTKELIASNLDKLRPVATTVFITHTVKKDETLDAICSLYNISKTTLLKANNLRTAQLPKGLRLQIPSTSTKYGPTKDGQQPEDRVAKVGNKNKQQQIVKHTLKPGETLESVAKQYQVSMQHIMQWNKLTGPIKMKQGQQLTLNIDRPAPPAENLEGTSKTTKVVAKIATDIKGTAQVPTLEATKKRSVAKVQPEAAPKQLRATAQKEQPPTWYVVKNGDTLVTVAKKFQATAQNIRNWNKLSSNTLQTGDKLIVKKG